MRSCIAFFIVFFNALQAQCQADTSFIPIAAYWEKGDSFDFRITKVKRSWQDRELVREDSIQYIAQFLVKDADSLSYTIEWTFKNGFFDLLGLPWDSREKFPAYQTIRVIYKTDEFGTFIGIQNWRDISRMINDLTDEVFRVKSPDVGISTGDLKKTLEQLRSVYSTQRGIEQLVFSELLRMHFPFGKRYKRGEIYKYTEQIPIMVNSEPATGNGIIFIRKARLDKQRCELVQQMIIHPDSAEKMLTKYFHSMGMNPQAIPGTVNNSTLEVNEENIYDYYYFPGIPVKLSATRETRINVMDDRIRHTEMTLIEQIQP